MRTKAAAWRSGYRRALKDVEREVERLQDAVQLVAKLAAANHEKTDLLRDVLGEIDSRIIWPLQKRVDEDV